MRILPLPLDIKVQLSVHGIELEPEWSEVVELLRRDPCTYCGRTGVAIHIDHMIPRVKGGSDALGNLTAACDSCNMRKGTRDALQFALRRYGVPVPIEDTPDPNLPEGFYLRARAVLDGDEVECTLFQLVRPQMVTVNLRVPARSPFGIGMLGGEYSRQDVFEVRQGRRMRWRNAAAVLHRIYD